MKINKSYRLDKRIEIQSFTTAKNGKGEDIRTWSKVSDVWANVIYKGGSEPYEADQKVGLGLVVFTIRYLSSVTQLNRIVWGSDTYDILDINGDKRTRYMNLTCEKKDND